MMGNCGAIAGPQNEVTKGWGCGPGFLTAWEIAGRWPADSDRCLAAGWYGQLLDAQQGGPMQMRGWGRGFHQREWNPGPGADNMGQQEWNMPRRERMDVPPPEWGW